MTDLEHTLAVLRPRRGDMLVVYAEPERQHDVLQLLLALRVEGAASVPIVVLRPTERIEVLPKARLEAILRTR